MKFSTALTAYALALSLTLSAAPVDASTPVGYVKRVTGAVVVTRNGVDRNVKIGDAMHKGDVYRTGGESSLGFTLLDGTRMSTGEESRFSLEHYEFDRQAGAFGFMSRLYYGTYEYISGMIAKLAPGTTEFRTPNGTIRPEGTRLAVRLERPRTARQTRTSSRR